MKNNIYINKKGILQVNPIWISINNGRYKLYFSNPIQLSTNQKDNTIKLREMLFIHSKKVDICIEDTSVSLEIKITNLDRRLRIGIIIVSLFCMFYVVSPWNFFPTQTPFYVLFGYIGISAIFLLIFKRKDYFTVQMD